MTFGSRFITFKNQDQVAVHQHFGQSLTSFVIKTRPATKTFKSTLNLLQFCFHFLKESRIKPQDLLFFVKKSAEAREKYFFKKGKSVF